MRFHIGFSYSFKSIKKFILFFLFAMFCFFIVDKVFAQSETVSDKYYNNINLKEIDFSSISFIDLPSEDMEDLSMQDVFDIFKEINTTNINYNILVYYDYFSEVTQDITVFAIPKSLEFQSNLLSYASLNVYPTNDYTVYGYTSINYNINNLYALSINPGTYNLFADDDYVKFVKYLSGEYIPTKKGGEWECSIPYGDDKTGFCPKRLLGDNFPYYKFNYDINKDLDLNDFSRWIYYSSFDIPYNYLLIDESYEESSSLYVLKKVKVNGVEMSKKFITYLDVNPLPGDDPYNPEKDPIEDLNNNIMDPSIDDNSGFFTDFSDNDFGLSGIVKAPLRVIQGLTTGSSCTPLKFTILGKDVEMPSGCILWDKVPDSIETIYYIFIFGGFAYVIGTNLFHDIEDMKNPEKDEVSTLDL